MELRLYLQMLQRGWWIILLVAVVAFAASLGISYTAVPQYSAVARFIITPGASLTTGRDVVSGLQTLDRGIVATYVEVMNSRRILSESLALLNIAPADIEDQYSIVAVELPDSSVIELTVLGPNPSVAADLANTIGNNTIGFARSLNTVYIINILDTAVPPQHPFSPQPVRDAAVALVLGLLVGALLAIVSEQIRVPLEAYRQRVRIDNVTGVYHSRYFTSLLEEELARHPDDVLSLGVVELSGLEDLLDTLPATALQWVLQNVTGTLRKELRGHDLIGRLSDNTFIVMLPATPGFAAKRTFARILQALSQPVTLSQYGVTVEFDPHIGGAVYSNNISSRDLLEKARNSVDRARRDHDNPIYVWEMNNPFWVEKDINSSLEGSDVLP
jgi:diguanylate cyclase (GGDEF)-like protein